MRFQKLSNVKRSRGHKATRRKDDSTIEPSSFYKKTREGRRHLLRPSIIRVRSLSSNSVAGAASMPRLRNQDGIEKGISRLQLKLPTSISISAPIYSHRPYKRVCSNIGFSLYRPLAYHPPLVDPTLSLSLSLVRPHHPFHSDVRARINNILYNRVYVI